VIVIGPHNEMNSEMVIRSSCQPPSIEMSMTVTLGSYDQIGILEDRLKLTVVRHNFRVLVRGRHTE
jgi:hypothetical protein